MKRLWLISIFICVAVMSLNAKSKTDKLIATTEQLDSNTFVAIISNENYKYEPSVPYAWNDGDIFKLYCGKTLGIPDKNIRYRRDATLNDMRILFDWLGKVMKAYKGEARAIVYYSGHGMPSEDGKQSYLLPVDGISHIPTSGFSTKEFYKQLGEMPSKGIVVFLDACFSGAQRNGNMLNPEARALVRAASQEEISGNVVVFSASKSNETAFPYKEKAHGLFTYFLLEQIREKGGYVSLGELSDKVTESVERISLVVNDKSQTPTITPSPSVKNEWRKWMLAKTRAKKLEKESTTEHVAEPTSHSEPIPTPSTTPAPRPQQEKIEFSVNGVTFNMILVKGGTFSMGEFDSETKDSLSHSITLENYYIGESEVTQELWEAVMGRNPSKFRGKHNPVECVSWKKCQDFVSQLSELTGKTFRLPTEAEWEYAARGGQVGHSSKYAGGDTINDVAHYADNSEERSQNVKKKKPNELGIYDMSGNVWEWCIDAAGGGRVIRGGSWFDVSKNCLVSCRKSEPSSYLSSNIGVRIAYSTSLTK